MVLVGFLQQRGIHLRGIRFQLECRRGGDECRRLHGSGLSRVKSSSRSMGHATDAAPSRRGLILR